MPEKSAEELAQIIIDIVRHVERNAKHAAMLEAAEIAETKSNYHLDGMEGADWKEFITEEAYHVQANNLKQSILTAAKKYEE